MTTTLVDFHCHLDLYPSLDSAVREAEEAGLYTLAVTTTPKAWPRNYEVTRFTPHVRAGLGLHPQLVAERHAEIALWEDYLPQTRYVGEVGLDAGPQYYRSFDLQKRVFERILKQCAKAGGKVLSVHSVRAAAPVLDLIQACLPSDRGQVVLHWFTGSKAEARRATELGCYFSINAAMMTKEKGRALVAALPLERILTETDGPFTQIDGRPARPVDVETTIGTLANLLHLTPEVTAATVQNNLRTLLTSAGVVTGKWSSAFTEDSDSVAERVLLPRNMREPPN
jgi:TatD DNase family protein